MALSALAAAPAAPPPTTTERYERRGNPLEERRLLVRYRRHGDLQAREELVRRFLPLAKRLAGRFRTKEPYEDLVQVASVGLLNAIDRFDPDNGGSFSSYAVPTILGELKRYFRDHSWSVRVPRSTQERVLKVNSVIEELTNRSQRPPSVEAIAAEIGATPEEVLEAMHAGSAYDALSLDVPRFGEEEDGAPFGESVGTVDENYSRVENAVTVDALLEVLPERERVIFHMRFVEELTQAEIGERIGVSQMQVSRVLRRALGRLNILATTR